MDTYLKLLKPLKNFCLVGLPAVSTPLSVRRPLAPRRRVVLGSPARSIPVRTPTPHSHHRARAPPQFEPFSIVDCENAIIGSKIGSPKVMAEMLAFSAKHKCFPQVEMIDFKDANEGFKRLIAGTPRYRVVMKIEGFREAQTHA